MKLYSHHQVSELNMSEHFLGSSKAFEILANLGLELEPLAQITCKGGVHPYAHPQHMKVLKHFILPKWMREAAVSVAYSLNHDTTATAHLGSTLPQFSKLWPPSAQV